MTEKYKRIQDVEEKIHSVKLPYNAWKVFFLIDNEVSAPQISEYLDEDISIVNEGLDRLLMEGLVQSVAVEEEPVEEYSEKDDLVEEDQEIDLVMDLDASEDEPLPEEKDTNLNFEQDDIEMELQDLDLGVENEETTPDLGEEMPDFTEDLISVVEDEDPVQEKSLDDLVSEDLEIDEELQMDLDTEQLESTESEIEIEDIEEEKDFDFDVSNLDVDFAEEIAEEPVPAAGKPAIEPKEEKVGSKTVLVIDDSIVIRKMVEIALEDENYKLVTAVSGKDGLAMLDEKRPDLVILDLMLPDINGIDLLKTIKASKGTPVIMLSGKDSPQMVEKARAEGADAFLPKPFKDDELVEKIKELIN